MRIYISGPISSARSIEEAIDRFKDAEYQLHFRNYETRNPFDIKPKSCVNPGRCASGPHGHLWECWIRWDLIEMLKCDGVALLPSWQFSPGARLEQFVALQGGLTVEPLYKWIKE